MKAQILLLILLSSLMMGCRSKHKITTTYKENTKETESIKADSMSLHDSKSVQSENAEVLIQEKKNEMSGDILIKGKSDAGNPFVFHNVVEGDTVQSISIKGNAEYLVKSHYVKTDHKRSEIKKEESASIIQDSVQKTLTKETTKEVASKVSEENKKITSTGFEAAAWIFITIIGITLILIFFTYKYFKK